jgi:cell division septal protein FtsQ
VSLARVLPSTIVIDVVERTPLAIARLGQQLYLVDDTGVIIDEYRADYHDLDLPIVDGLLSSPGAAGPLADVSRVHLAGSLLASLGTRADLGRRVSQVDVSNAHDAVVMFDDDAAWLHLGDQRFGERLNTYLELGPMLHERFQDIDYVDLRFDDRVFVHAKGRAEFVAPARP